MSTLTILRTYAQKNPATLPSSIHFTHTSTSLTIHDAHPKSIFHFLLLPRVQEPLTVSDLASLRLLLQANKARAKEVITALNEDAKAVRKEIEDEMIKRYGFKWGIWTGFHAVPSMEHLHLHVLSDDLCSPTMKHKKHYNSFHPKLGFFLHIDDVLSWFDAEPSYYSSMSEIAKNQYEPILKETLSCWRCGVEMKNMPTLKAHLQEEWDNEAIREKARVERKRKLEDKQKVRGDSDEDRLKRRKGDTDE